MAIVAISCVELTYCVERTWILGSTTPPRSHAACAPGANPEPVTVTVLFTSPSCPYDGSTALTDGPLLAFAAERRLSAPAGVSLVPVHPRNALAPPHRRTTRTSWPIGARFMVCSSGGPLPEADCLSYEVRVEPPRMARRGPRPPPH